MYLYTVKQEDVNYSTFEARGKSYWVAGIFGHFQPQDVGKRIYLVNGVLQMENNQQLAARRAREGES